MRKNRIFRIACVTFALFILFSIWHFSRAATFSVMAWQYDFTANAPCTATVTTNCVNKFELHHFALVSGSDILDTTIPVTGTPSGLTSLTTPLPPSYPSTGFGTVQGYMIAVGFDSTGAVIKSGQAPFSIARVPDAPINPHAQ